MYIQKLEPVKEIGTLMREGKIKPSQLLARQIQIIEEKNGPINVVVMDSQTDSPLYGRTNNPWNVEYTSGDSSGVSAAAVASGMSFLDIGNDLLGSVRIPTGYCGIHCMESILLIQ